MYTSGRGSNDVYHRESEIFGRVKSLSKHLRDPDKIPDLWVDSPDNHTVREVVKNAVDKKFIRYAIQFHS